MEYYDLSVPIQRTNRIPLETKTVFSSKEELDAYLASKTSTAYPGQYVSVSNDTKTTPYVITAALKAVEITPDLQLWLAQIKEEYATRIVNEFGIMEAGGTHGVEYKCLVFGGRKIAVVNSVGAAIDTDIIIVDKLHGYPVEELYGFTDSKITSIIIPDSCYYIGDEAFKGCTDLTNIRFPENDNFNTIFDFSFQGCTALSTVNLPPSVIDIRNSAFQDCTNLVSISLANIQNFGTRSFMNCLGITENILLNNSSINFGAEAFRNCKGITKVELTDMSSVMLWGSVFTGCTSLNEVIIESGNIMEKDGNQFNDCTSLTSITLGVIPRNSFEGTFGIPEYFCYGCSSLSNVSLPSDISGWIVRAYAFAQSGLPTITLKGVHTIKEKAFSQCTNLSSIKLGKSLQVIEAGALEGCSNLTDIYYEGTETEWNIISIADNNECFTNSTIHFECEI